VGSNGRGGVQSRNFWKHKRIDVASAMFPHCTHTPNFSSRRREKRACRRPRDSSTMIRAGTENRAGRASDSRFDLYGAIDGKASLRRGPLRFEERSWFIVMSNTERPALRQRRLRAPCVYAHVTPVTKLLINAILSRRRHYAIDPRRSSLFYREYFYGNFRWSIRLSINR